MKELTIKEFELMLCSTGFLPPRTEEEHIFFEQMFEDYSVRTINYHVDVDAIINGNCVLVEQKRDKTEFDKIESLSISDDFKFSMAARNFDKLPKEVIEKIKKQHNRKDEEK